MILVTVGTHTQPFDRLVKAADAYASAHPDIDVIIQKGVSDYECKYAKAFAFCPKEEMSKYLADAEATYFYLDIHYAYQGTCEDIQKSEKTITIASQKKDVIAQIITTFGITVDATAAYTAAE